MGERRRTAGAHVRKDDAAALLARIRDVAHLRREARLRWLAGHLEAAAVRAELPAVVGAAHAVVVDLAEKEGGRAVGAEFADEPGPPALAPEGDEWLAEEPDTLDAPAGLDLAGLDDGDPVTPEERAHRRPRTRPRQELVVFAGQHGSTLLAGEYHARRAETRRPPWGTLLIRSLNVEDPWFGGGAPSRKRSSELPRLA